MESIPVFVDDFNIDVYARWNLSTKMLRDNAPDALADILHQCVTETFSGTEWSAVDLEH